MNMLLAFMNVTLLYFHKKSHCLKYKREIYLFKIRNLQSTIFMRFLLQLDYCDFYCKDKSII